jgi:hypothetical protein
MQFEDIRNNNPDLVCACGHRADKHLYCADHVCVRPGCQCQGFDLQSGVSNVLAWFLNALADEKAGCMTGLLSVRP